MMFLSAADLFTPTIIILMIQAIDYVPEKTLHIGDNFVISFLTIIVKSMPSPENNQCIVIAEF